MSWLCWEPWSKRGGSGNAAHVMGESWEPVGRREGHLYQGLLGAGHANSSEGVNHPLAPLEGKTPHKQHPASWPLARAKSRG